jgi:hypothetical protein
MPRSLPLAGIGLAALLGLTGCSTASPGTREASSSPSEAAATHSSEELAELLGTVTDADGAPLRVIPAAQIEQSMEQAQQFLDAITVTVTVTPEACRVFVSNSLDVPDGAGYATGVSGTDGDAIQTILSVSSSADTAFAQDRLTAAEEALEPCESFTVEAQGIGISQSVEPLDASTDADRTAGTVTRQQSPDGAVQQTMTVTGNSGSLTVTAVRTAPNEVPEGTQAQLQDLVDAIFATVG